MPNLDRFQITTAKGRLGITYYFADTTTGRKIEITESEALGLAKGVRIGGAKVRKSKSKAAAK